MTDRYSAMSNHGSHCASSAAACTSARIDIILDAALLAVSIFIVRLVSLLVLKV